MSVGLLAVVDDILSAALKASAKSAGVVIDDAAVTPQYVQGLSPARELPVVGRIALGSLANKFLVIIPIALLLTAFAPWVLPWLLIAGGSYLCFEGAEKVLEWFGFHHGGHDGEEGGRDEKRLVAGAVRTDLINRPGHTGLALDRDARLRVLCSGSNREGARVVFHSVQRGHGAGNGSYRPYAPDEREDASHSVALVLCMGAINGVPPAVKVPRPRNNRARAQGLDTASNAALSRA